MVNYNSSHDSDELKSYGGLGYMVEYRKAIDEKNANTLMHAQFDLIKRQRKEILEENKYREENRKATKFSTRLLIASIIISIVSLIVSIISLYK